MVANHWLELDVTKKILFVTNDFGPRAGGIESFIHGLLVEMGHTSVTLYTSSQGDTQKFDADWFKEYGVRVIRDRARVLLPSPRICAAVAKLVKNEQIEVVVFGAAAPLALMAPSLRAAGAKRIIALTHGHELWWSRVFPFSLAIRRIGATTDVLTYLGEFTRLAISQSLSKEAADAMVRMAPGIDADHFAPVDTTSLKKTLKLDDKKVIVCVARLVPRKGQDFLLKAMNKIIGQVPNAHLLIIGSGSYQKKLQRLVSKYELQDCVSFVGRIQYSDLPRYICLGDVFAMPSRTRFAGLEVEGLGISYLEASACSLPVIAGASGGAPDAVIDGVTGFLVNPVDSLVIAEAVIALLNNPALSKKMGESGRQWVVEKWRWEIWADAFRELING